MQINQYINKQTLTITTITIITTIIIIIIINNTYLGE